MACKVMLFLIVCVSVVDDDDDDIWAMSLNGILIREVLGWCTVPNLLVGAV